MVYRALNDTFDNEVTALLTAGWQREGKFRIDTGGGLTYGVQMLTRTSYVEKAGEEDTDCDHDWQFDAGEYVCTHCGCYGVRLSRSQRSKLGQDAPYVICTALYEEKFLLP